MRLQLISRVIKQKPRAISSNILEINYNSAKVLTLLSSGPSPFIALPCRYLVIETVPFIERLKNINHVKIHVDKITIHKVFTPNICVNKIKIYTKSNLFFLNLEICISKDVPSTGSLALIIFPTSFKKMNVFDHGGNQQEKGQITL